MRAGLLLLLPVLGCGGNGNTFYPPDRAVFTDFLGARKEAVESASMADIAGTYADDYLYHCRDKAAELARWTDLLGTASEAEFEYRIHRGGTVSDWIGYAQCEVTVTLTVEKDGESLVFTSKRGLLLRRDAGVWKDYGGGSCP
jgi:hypothetical protein